MREKLLLGIIVFFSLVLRVYKLGDVPPSLYWDEASLGYNAFAVSQTLRDEHGESLPLTRFIAFGDYKPPGYVYAAAIPIKIFGLSEITTRLPSALAGVGLVVIAFLLGKELFGSQKKKVSLVSALLVAISPWALQFSRGAFEANLATFLSGLAIYLFLRSVRRASMGNLIACALSLAAAMYTFNTHRVFVPLMVGFLVLVNMAPIRLRLRRWLIFAVVVSGLVSPLLVYSQTREGLLRFNEVSWIYDLDPIETANARQEVDGGGLVSRLIHNRRWLFALEFFRHYTDHFKMDFLFIRGDVNPKLSIQSVGQLYLWEIVTVAVGGYGLLKRNDRVAAVILGWVLVGLVPAALARETPHALRTLNVLPVPQIVSALGVVKLGELAGFSRKRMVVVGGLIVVAFSFALYLHSYYVSYPRSNSLAWQDGYKEMVEYVRTRQEGYDGVSVTGAYGRPYVYFLYYGGPYDVTDYWKTRQGERDWFGFWTIHGFGKYVFSDKLGEEGRWLYVRAPRDVPVGVKVVKTIDDLAGNAVFVIFEDER